MFSIVVLDKGTQFFLFSFVLNHGWAKHSVGEYRSLGSYFNILLIKSFASFVIADHSSAKYYDFYYYNNVITLYLDIQNFLFLLLS